MIKIGVVSPTYNRPQSLLRLHKSLVETGDGVDWLHSVVDDGSSECYADTLQKCEAVSGRLRYKRIENSGPLVARNHAIEIAIDEGCTYLCFIDDDDWLIHLGLKCIAELITKYQEYDWFIFRSQKGSQSINSFTSKAIQVDWFEDGVLGNVIESDSLCVVSANFIGGTRFSPMIRNQREWTFFLDLYKKKPLTILFPDVVQKKEYQRDGLTRQARARCNNFSQIANSIHRAYRYWMIDPSNHNLALGFCRQLLLTPPKLVLAALSMFGFRCSRKMKK